MGTAHECDKLISFPYSQRLGATLAQALETGLASWVARTRAAESVSCVFPAPKLKREQSLAARFGRADASYYDISSTWIADGFLSSSPTCPARQCSLYRTSPVYGIVRDLAKDRSLRRSDRLRNCFGAIAFPVIAGRNGMRSELTFILNSAG